LLGATTLSIPAFSIGAFDVMTLISFSRGIQYDAQHNSIQHRGIQCNDTHNIPQRGIRYNSVRIFSMMSLIRFSSIGAFSIMTLSITLKNATLRITV
jgi:hypothetical protein